MNDADSAGLLETWRSFLSAATVIENAGWHDNYTDAARARETQAKAISRAKAIVDRIDAARAAAAPQDEDEEFWRQRRESMIR